jgi:protocatechuate 3,4-dioxygenase beta subunit
MASDMIEGLACSGAGPYNATDPFLNSAGRKDLLIAKRLDPTPEFEPDSKMVRFDIVVYKG